MTVEDLIEELRQMPLTAMVFVVSDAVDVDASIISVGYSRGRVDLEIIASEVVDVNDLR